MSGAQGNNKRLLLLFAKSAVTKMKLPVAENLKKKKRKRNKYMNILSGGINTRANVKNQEKNTIACD